MHQDPPTELPPSLHGWDISVTDHAVRQLINRIRGFSRVKNHQAELLIRAGVYNGTYWGDHYSSPQKFFRRIVVGQKKRPCIAVCAWEHPLQMITVITILTTYQAINNGARRKR